MSIDQNRKKSLLSSLTSSSHLLDSNNISSFDWKNLPILRTKDFLCTAQVFFRKLDGYWLRKIEQIFKYHRCIINGGRPFKTRQKKVTEITSFIFYDDKKILGKVGFQQQKCISFVALEFRCIYGHNVTKRFLKSHFTFY